VSNLHKLFNTLHGNINVSHIMYTFELEGKQEGAGCALGLLNIKDC